VLYSILTGGKHPLVCVSLVLTGLCGGWLYKNFIMGKVSAAGLWQGMAYL
jgi:hypothetical protein